MILKKSVRKILDKGWVGGHSMFPNYHSAIMEEIMQKKPFLWVVLLVCTVSLFLPVERSSAATDGRLRHEMEDLYFGEFLIRSSLYSVSRSDVYHPGKRKFIHGIPRIKTPFIYEPDVYTWELAMAAHRRTLPKRLVLLHKSGGYVVPKAMIPSNMVPAGQVQLTPLGSSQMLSSAPLPENYEANKLNNG